MSDSAKDDASAAADLDKGDDTAPDAAATATVAAEVDESGAFKPSDASAAEDSGKEDSSVGEDHDVGTDDVKAAAAAAAPEEAAPKAETDADEAKSAPAEEPVVVVAPPAPLAAASPASGGSERSGDGAAEGDDEGEGVAAGASPVAPSAAEPGEPTVDIEVSSAAGAGEAPAAAVARAPAGDEEVKSDLAFPGGDGGVEGSSRPLLGLQLTEEEQQAPVNPAPFTVPAGTMETIATRENLSLERRSMLEALFHALDRDDSSFLTMEEALEMATILGATRQQAKETVRRMLAVADKDHNNKLDMGEWLDFFATQTGNLTDEQFRTFFLTVTKTVERGQRPVAWPGWLYYVFGGIMLVQIVIRTVLIVLTAEQWSAWNNFDELAGMTIVSSPLRMTAATVGVLLSLVGLALFWNPKLPRKLLPFMGVAGLVLVLLFLASGITDGITYGIVKTDCDFACRTDCAVVPPAEHDMCTAVACECGYTIDVGSSPEVQDVVITTTIGDPTGTFTLTAFAPKGFTTSAIAATATAADVQAALRNIPIPAASGPNSTFNVLVGGVTVTSLPSPTWGWRVTFDSQMTDMRPMAAKGSLSGANARIAVHDVTHGRPGSLVVAKPSDINESSIVATLVLNFVAMVTSGVAAVIGLYYTTACGRNAYLKDLSAMMADWRATTRGVNAEAKPLFTFAFWVDYGQDRKTMSASGRRIQLRDDDDDDGILMREESRNPHSHPPTPSPEEDGEADAKAEA